MTAPPKRDRDRLYRRDRHVCVSCGRGVGLQAQHRRAVGQGGSKLAPTLSDLLTSCWGCNPRYEGDMQGDALRYGWKVRRWVTSPAEVPVFVRSLRAWFVLDDDGHRVQVTETKARRMMRAVYGEEADA